MTVDVWRDFLGRLDRERPVLIVHERTRHLLDGGWDLIGSLVVGSTSEKVPPLMGPFGFDDEELRIDVMRVALARDRVYVRTVILGLEGVTGAEQDNPPDPEIVRREAEYRRLHDAYWRRRTAGLRPGDAGWEDA